MKAIIIFRVKRELITKPDFLTQINLLTVIYHIVKTLISFMTIKAQ